MTKGTRAACFEADFRLGQQLSMPINPTRATASENRARKSQPAPRHAREASVVYHSSSPRCNYARRRKRFLRTYACVVKSKGVFAKVRPREPARRRDRGGRRFNSI